MANEIQIIGYVSEARCDHCGRALRHGIRIDDGRTVGASCLANVLTAPRRHAGKAYRYAPATVVDLAKVAEFAPAHLWANYGFNTASATFLAA